MKIDKTTGLTVAEVAAVTGLDKGEIYRVQAIMALGAPGHFAYLSATQVYTIEGLCQMAEGLAICGHGVAAAALRVKLEQMRGPAVAGPGPVVAGWMAAQEAKEDAA